MKIEIIKCLHVTATERRHLKLFLASGLTSAKVNTKTYTIIQGTQIENGWQYVVKIQTPFINGKGIKDYNRQTITINYTEL